MLGFVPATMRMCIVAVAAGSLMSSTQGANAVPAAQHQLATPFKPIPVEGLECNSKKVCVANCLNADKRNNKASCETFCSQCKGD